MPAFMSTRPTARPKICLLKSRRSTHAGRRAVRDSTLVAWYRSIYAPRTGGAYDSHPRTAGIAGRTRRRGCCVATRGARATGDDAGRSEAKEGLMEKGFAERFARSGLLHGIPMISNAFSIITRTTLKCRPRSSPHWLENVPESFGAKWQSADIGPRRFNPYQTFDSNCSRRWPA